MTDYYTILQVSDSASTAEIKAAYRRLALQFHPDRNPNENALAQFNTIQKAYELLSDPAQRRQYDLKRNIEQAVPGIWDNLEPTLVGEDIRMVLSKQRVKAGEPFSVHFRCPRKVDYFKLGGLQHFDIVKSVEHDLWMAGKTVTEVHYVLMALQEGEFVIGPATAGIGELVYRSKQDYVLVEGQYHRPQMSWLAKVLPVFLIMFLIFFPVLIFYNISTYGIKKFNKEPTILTESALGNRLITGEAPYASMESGLIPNPTGFCQLVITNHRQMDAVMILVDPLKNEPVANVYVRSGQRYVIRRMAPHYYHAYLFSGVHWRSDKPLGLFDLQGTFEDGLYFDYIGVKEGGIVARQSAQGDDYFYSSHTLELLPREKNKPTYHLIMDTAYF